MGFQKLSVQYIIILARGLKMAVRTLTEVIYKEEDLYVAECP